MATDNSEGNSELSNVSDTIAEAALDPKVSLKSLISGTLATSTKGVKKIAFTKTDPRFKEIKEELARRDKKKKEETIVEE